MTLEREAAAGNLKRPFFSDPSLDLLMKLGIEHEQQQLRRFKQEPGADVEEIPTGISWARAVAKTADALRAGAPVVYQAALQIGEWGGRPDFLIRVDRPSALGFWSYEAIETKLARSTKVPALIQLCLYSELLNGIQGLEPENMHLVLGGGSEPESFQVKRFAAYFRRVKREFQEWCEVVPAVNLVANSRLKAELQADEIRESSVKAELQTAAPSEYSATYPEPNEHCSVCCWAKHCDAQWRRDDHLSLVARITRNQRRALAGRGVGTVASLAALALPFRPRIERIGAAALETIREQARLQVEGRDQGRTVYELLPLAGDRLGLAALPPPSTGDMFFDFEGAAYAFDDGLEYLFGIVTLNEPTDRDQSAASKSGSNTFVEGTAATPRYHAIWALNRPEEKQAFERFIEMVMERWAQHPDMHIYHYAVYEPTAIKRLAVRHGTRVDEVDRLLRAGVFVDLYRIVRQSLRASVESYSIKKMEPLYGFDRSTDLQDANLALKAFEAVLAFGQGQDPDSVFLLRDAIEGYNRDDCISTHRLRDWLEERRQELERRTGHLVPRPPAESGEPGEGLAALIEKTSPLVTSLMAELGGGVRGSEQGEEQSARWLLAQMLEWHRRENKSTWWEYFRLCGLSDQELQEDKNALGGLVYAGEAGREKRSIIHRYCFVAQDQTIDRANQVHDPRTKSGAGSVVVIDELNNTIDLKRAASSAVPHPDALIPYDIVSTQVLSDSLLRLASWVVEHGIVGPGRFRAARDLLLRRPPRLKGGLLAEVIAGEGDATERAKRAVLVLEDSLLAIQGPPGSGKTYVGARMVLELVRNQKVVGITAASHKVISKILDEVCRAADEAGVPLRAVQKIGSEEGTEPGSGGTTGNLERQGIERGLSGSGRLAQSPDEDGIERRSDASGGSSWTVSEDGGTSSEDRTHPRVTRVKGNPEVVDAIKGGVDVIAGTAWLWAREEFADSVDVLFVDEAGQMSLANVLAVSRAARSLVLLGDPQQLDQPKKGIHPPGADVSAMAHVLCGEATIHPALGMFLGETWRLHPDVCTYTSEVFYQGRLRPRAENSNQRVNADGLLDGTGLRFFPVEHAGNQSESPEEVERVAQIVHWLLRNPSTWTNRVAV
jgi:uncharacterized protein